MDIGGKMKGSRKIAYSTLTWEVGAMAKAKRTLTQAEANAYKTKSEGKALLVKAWMPLMLKVTTVVGGLVTLWLFGV